jgi:SAM-dependent methyltransferase
MHRCPAKARCGSSSCRSTRYFEFDYVERATATLTATRYFDVSSPRLVPVMFALPRNALLVDMINPDPKDLAASRQLVAAVGLSGRCRLHACLIVDAPFEPETFDVVTCVSVLEHIPEDSDALRSMWATLKSGGTLVLTVPCMARACEQYIDEDEYGLLPKDQNGYVFWQRFYDSALLDKRVFSVLGRPVNIEVYGEKIRGSFARNAEQKRRLRHAYLFWREPYMMGREYRRFRTLEELPGDGVVAMTFIKP